MLRLAARTANARQPTSVDMRRSFHYLDRTIEELGGPLVMPAQSMPPVSRDECVMCAWIDEDEHAMSLGRLLCLDFDRILAREDIGAADIAFPFLHFARLVTYMRGGRPCR